MHKLIIEDDEGHTTVVPLVRDEIVIGRKEGSAIRLTERNVSRKHAKLFRQNAAIYIEDLGSYNGIRVNGTLIAGRKALAEGDRVQIGDYILGLKVDHQTGAAGGQGLAAKGEAARAAAVTGDVRVDAVTGQTNLPGRLVCVSSNFPGQEFVLDKPAMVIGRTDDNDISIAHRSISRHHAQVMMTDGRCVIEDLGSANGIRVNGEDYQSIELQRGDFVDLGHVRLRYVAPGEDFVFGRDATIIEAFPVRGKRRSGVWLFLLLIVIGAAGSAAWIRMRYGSHFAFFSAARHSVGALGELARKAGVKTGSSESTDQLAALDRTISDHDWDKAISLCETAKDSASSGAMKQPCERVQEERNAKQIYDRAQSAAQSGKSQEALHLFASIPKTSIYYDSMQTSALYNNVRDKYRGEALAKIARQVKESQCAEARATLTALKQLLPEVVEADEQVQGCAQAPVVAPRAPAPRRAAGEGKAGHRAARAPSTTLPPETPAHPATDEEQRQAQTLLDEASSFYREGYYERAAEMTREVLRVMPRNQQALSILGASACYLKRAHDAKAAFERLSLKRRQLLALFCERMGMTLE